MKAVIYDFSILRYLTLTAAGMVTKRVFWGGLSPVRLTDVPEPKLPNRDWVIVKTILSGICASDMSAIMMKDSPTLTPFASFPFIPGHENVGTIAEVGSGVSGFSVGDRVAINPALSCEARGMDEICASCMRGETSICEMAAEGKVAVGVTTGYSKETGGGWSPYFLAHKSQLFKLDGISDDDAVMIDAFCSALHPVMRNFPKDDEAVLIIGTGPLGLSAITSIRALGGKARIIVLERSRFSGGLAKEAGCDVVVYPKKKGGSIYDEIANLTGATAYNPILGGKILIGGVDRVFDTVGHAETINMSLRMLKNGGTYVMIGLAADEKLDLTPLWFKELKIVGTLGYGMEEYAGGSVHTWGVALDLLKKKKIDLKKYITHKFPIEDYREAIKVNIYKERYRAIKTAFAF